MKLIRASVHHFRLPFARPLHTSRGVLREREGFVLELHASSGTRGAGEASPAYWLGADQIEDTRASLERIVKAVTSRPEIVDLRALMIERPSRLSSAAACALDTALLDLDARERGISLASILGARQLESIPVCALLTATESEKLRSEAARAVDAGYRCVKIKVGAAATGDDIRRVEAARQAVGPGIAIRLDANRAWSLDQARAAVSGLAPFGIEFLEEPVKDATPAALAELTAVSPIPMALDESVGNLEDLSKYIESNAAHVLVLKAVRVGGLTPAVRTASIASQAGMKIVVTDSIETSLGMSAAVHLASAIAASGTAVGLGGARLLRQSATTGFVSSPYVRPAEVGLDLECAAIGHGCDA